MTAKKNQPIRVLLAEDDADDCELFQDALAAADINALLITFNDGEKLMKHLANAVGEHTDIIFLDISMPCKNGKECVKEIRMNHKLKHVPIVMFSNSSYEEDIEETFLNGANLYITKPVFFHDEVKILKQIFAFDWQKELLKPDKKRFILYAPNPPVGRRFEQEP